LGSLVWILLLALLTQTISAWVRWNVASRAALVGLFLIPGIFTTIVNEVFQTHYANLFNLQSLIANVWAGLFGRFARQASEIRGVRNGRVVSQIFMTEPPLWASWMMLFLICAFCLWLLSRKVKAYEVVK
jgi:hypothetical protein